jgi:DNA-binding transcriptional MerR regulator
LTPTLILAYAGQVEYNGHMVAAGDTRSYRIGEVARHFGVTTRTIRYYEELGLLGADGERRKGSHRLYDSASIARLEEVLRVRDLLALSFDASLALAHAERARAVLRSAWADDPSDRDQLRILDQAYPQIERQLELVQERQATLAGFARELRETLRAIEAARVVHAGLRSAG